MVAVELIGFPGFGVGEGAMFGKGAGGIGPGLLDGRHQPSQGQGQRCRQHNHKG